ncbi:MAG: iron ABC transporter permease [Coriobacteriaceae bacterium]|nr:iron ABC transporter permease [Coriobacteriaceae bacterium]
MPRPSSGRRRIEPVATTNPYAIAEEERRGMRPEARRLLILGIIVFVLVLAAMIAPTYIFQHSLVEWTPAALVGVALSNLNDLLGVFTGNGEAFEARFMVILVCAVSGGALGLCGSAYQGAFNNPLAAPKTLGVMAGGAIGALIFVVFLQDVGPQMPMLSTGSYTQAQVNAWLGTLNPLEWIWANYGQCLCSMLGCFLAVGIVIGITSVLGRGKLSNVVVIIFGQVFATAVTAIISFARYFYTAEVDAAGIDMVDQLREIENYTMVRDYSYIDLLIVILPIVICMVIVLCMRRRMTLLSFGDDEAAAMGINVNRTRYAMIIVCTIMVAFAISFCGHVAYLGFISAHLARRIVGPDFRYLLPASICTGAGLLTLIQYICQSGLPYTSPYSAGVVCSIVGPIIFLIVVLAQRGKGTSGEWQ